MKYLLCVIVTSGFLFCSCTSVNPPGKAKPLSHNNSELQKLTLPEGFQIEVFQDDLPNARSITKSPQGSLFVGTRSAGNVYALPAEAEEKIVLGKDLNMPNGVAFHHGDLFVAEVDKVWAYRNIEDQLPQIPEPELISDAFPSESHHGWKFISFGPDGKLYVPVGAPCNICLKEDERYASIMRMNPDGSELEVFAHGVRNTVGFTWHPETEEMYFTDNGRDMMGDDMPACELNHAPDPGMHFGYPFCHQGDAPDTKFTERPCSEFVAPVQNLGPHVAPLGVEFISGPMFPKALHGKLLIAEHGSWNRSTPIGYRIMMVTLDENYKGISYEPFIEGWLQQGSPWGRPVDLEFLDDGSLLISDDFAGVLYRVSYID